MLGNLNKITRLYKVNFMIVILYCSFVKCYREGELGKVFKGLSILFLMTTCESVIFSVKKMFI